MENWFIYGWHFDVVSIFASQLEGSWFESQLVTEVVLFSLVCMGLMWALQLPPTLQNIHFDC